MEFTSFNEEYDDSTMYGEEIIRELEQIVEQMDEELKDFSQSCWTKDQLMPIYSHLYKLGKQESVSITELYKLVTVLGRASRKLDLTGSKTTISTLKHTIGLISYALTLTEAGAQVHLVEGIDDKGRQLTSDIDLVYSDANGTHCVDYTNDPTLSEGSVRTFDRSEKLSKYKKLEGKLDFDWCIPEVTAYGIDQNLFNCLFTMTRYDKGPRTNDFEFSESMIAHMDDLSYTQVEEMLNHYSGKIISQAEDGSKLIESASRYVSKETANELLSVSGFNDERAGRSYDKFQLELREFYSAHPESRSNIEKYYSINMYDKYRDACTKGHIHYPEAARGMTEHDPFVRLTHINRLSRTRGTQVTLMSHCISKLDQERQYSPSDEECRRYPDGAALMGSTFTRVYKQGEKARAFSVHFNGNSYHTYRQLVKEVTKKSPFSGNLAKREELLRQEWKVLSKEGTSSLYIEDILEMTQDFTTGKQLLDFVNKGMIGPMVKICRNKLMSNIAMIQEVAHAITSSTRKKQFVKGKSGSYKGETLLFGIETVADRAAGVA